MVGVAIGILVLLIIMGANGYQMVRQLTGQLLQERLQAARATAQLLDSALAQSFHQLQVLASFPALAVPGADEAGQRGLLREMRPEIPLASYGLYLVDAGGRVRIAEPSHPGDLGAHFQQYEAVQRVLAGQPTAASDLEFMAAGHVPVVLLCVPLRDRAGGLCAAVDLRQQQLLPFVTGYVTAGQQQGGRTWHAMIMDSRGQTLATTERSEAFQRNEHPTFHAPLLAARRAAVGRAAVIAHRQPGVIGYHIMAFAPLYQAAWGISVGQTEAETYVPIVEIRNWNLLIGASALLLALLFAWWDTGTVVRPLRLLVGATQRIVGGDLETPVQVERHDELRGLANAFDTMRDHLKTSLAERTRREHEAQALYEVSREILALTDLRTTLTTIVGHARRLLRMEVAALCLHGEDGTPVLVGGLNGPGDVRLPEISDGSTHWSQGDHVICYSAERCPFVDPRYARTHAAATVQIGGRTLGALCVASSVAQPLTAEDTGLLSGLAALAAIAIRSDELHQQGHQLAVFSERDRISRDLHDDTLQALYGVNLALEYAGGLIDEDSHEAKRRVAQTLDIHTRIIQDIRGYIHNLRPLETPDRTLRTALEDVASEFHANARIPITLNLGDADAVSDLPVEVRNQLLLVVREALANVIKHARATRVTVEATLRDDVFALSVQDNGCGFDPTGLSSRYGLGLGTMTERARSIGARFRVTSAPEAGTTIELRLPWPRGAEVRNG
jgi:nitrate/nitrite-specific signal transduction histidine kinase